MRKHILDRPAAPPDVAPGRMLAIRRKLLPHKATLVLQRRPRVRTKTQRTLYFMQFSRA